MLERLRPDRVPRRTVPWYLLDVLLAGALVILTVQSARAAEYVETYGPTSGRQWWWLLAPPVMVAFRRSAPLGALAIATVAFALAESAGGGNATLAIPFLCYVVAMGRPPMVSGPLVLIAAGVASCTTWTVDDDSAVLQVGFFFIFAAVGWVVGVRVRANQARAQQLRDDAAAARTEATQAVARAIADERARLARELHDAVGHAVNVMVIQAGALRMTSAGDDSDDRAAALRQIERVGRGALADLDRMLGLMRADGTTAPLEPTHCISDIRALVDETRHAGVDVRLDDRCSGIVDESTERPASAAVYRIVQEALTNVLKHAGPTTVDVALECDDDEVRVAVVDHGRGAAAPSNGRPGLGLVGMNERVTVLGGAMRAGPRAGGGFGVEATIPRRRDAR